MDALTRSDLRSIAAWIRAGDGWAPSPELLTEIKRLAAGGAHTDRLKRRAIEVLELLGWAEHGEVLECQDYHDAGANENGGEQPRRAQEPEPPSGDQGRKGHTPASPNPTGNLSAKPSAAAGRSRQAAGKKSLIELWP